MTTKAITRPFTTSDITVMSNVTSILVRGTKITKLGGTAEPEQASPASIYIDLEVSHKQFEPQILASTEELGLILNATDALELGLLLVAMGLEDKTQDGISATVDRLKTLIEDIT